MKPTIKAESYNIGKRPEVGEPMTFDGVKYVITKVTDTTIRDDSGRAVSYPGFQIEAECQVEWALVKTGEQ